MIDALTALLSGHRSLLLGVLFSRAAARPAARDGPGAQRRREQWAALCWISEAAWSSVSAHSDRRLLTPLAARLRFLVLSGDAAPGRRGEPEAGGVEPRPRPRTVRGDLRRRQLVRIWSRCREARWTWQAHLDAYQSAPLLAQARAAELEEELELLAFRTGGYRRPLVISPAPLGEDARVGADDRAVIAEITERHLLPRFQLGRVMALVAASPHGCRRSWPCFRSFRRSPRSPS